LYTVEEPVGLADRCVVVRCDVDVRAAQIPASALCSPGGIRRSSVSTMTAHGIGGGGVLRTSNCVNCPCGAPQLGRPDVGGAGGGHDFTAAYACGVSEQFAAANRCRERSDGGRHRQPAPE
jgi:hypothetical protein